MVPWVYPRVIAPQYQNLLQTKGTPKDKPACKHSENTISVEVFPCLEMSKHIQHLPHPTAGEMEEGHLTKRNGMGN